MGEGGRMGLEETVELRLACCVHVECKSVQRMSRVTHDGGYDETKSCVTACVPANRANIVCALHWKWRSSGVDGSTDIKQAWTVQHYLEGLDGKWEWSI